MLKTHFYRARNNMDMVEITISNHTASLHYFNAKTLAQKLRVCAKGAFQQAGAPAATFRDWDKVEVPLATVPRHPIFRVSGLGETLKKYGCNAIDKQVRLGFMDATGGGFKVAMPPEECMGLVRWIETAAANAKNWAGDTRKGLIIAANLTNAEDNYRIGAR